MSMSSSSGKAEEDGSSSDDDEERRDTNPISALCTSIADQVRDLLQPSSAASDDELIRQRLGGIFSQYAEEILYKPNEYILKQGTKLNDLLMIKSGSVILTKTKADGSEEDIGIIRSSGETLGELSFLLGSAPVINVKATPVAAGQKDVLEPTVCYKLNMEKTAALLKTAPESMRQFFFTLSQTLSKRVRDVAAQQRRVQNASKENDEQTLAVRKGRSALAIAQAFGLKGHNVVAGDRYAAERDLLATVECLVSEELDGQTVGTDMPSAVFLFGTHICVERTVLGCLPRRDAFPLREVLGLVFERSGGAKGDRSKAWRKSTSLDRATETEYDNADTDASFKMSPAKAEAGAYRAFDLQMKGRSLRLSMPAERSNHISRLIEDARLVQQDLSLKDSDEDSTYERSVVSTTSTVLSMRSSTRSLGDSDGLAEASEPAARASTRSSTAKPAAATMALLDARIADGAKARKPRTKSIAELPAESERQVDQEEVDPIAEALQLLSSGAIPGSSPGQMLSASDWRAGAAMADSMLTEAEWKVILAIAKAKLVKKDSYVMRTDRNIESLYVIVRGSLSARNDVPGRAQSVVVQRLGPGNIIGEFALMMREKPAFDVVVDSEEAIVVRLPHKALEAAFSSNPLIAGKFYCFIATRQAEKLRRITQQEKTDLIIPEGTKAPKTIGEIMSNGAFLLILQNYIEMRPDSAELAPLIEFFYAVKDLQNEPDVENLLPIIKAIYQNFAADNAPRLVSAIPRALRTKMAEAIGMTRQFPDGRILRHVYDEPMQAAIDSIEKRAFSDFVSSPSYQYVLELKAKEMTPVTVDHFKVVRMLGKGAFGQVLEVIKRDCGRRYAMKVMIKESMAEAFGDSWERLTLVEKQLQASLHHPLLINLAYAFQNVRYLILVMDCCQGGDLEAFGASVDRNDDARSARHNGRQLTASQVQFVALEVCAVIMHLHRLCVMYRDLKPQNLMLDAEGHVRLIDFGIAEQGDVVDGVRVRPTSTVECGSGVYVAPEVRTCWQTNKPYNVSCDWFSFGVMLYELQEKGYPFGDMPIAYENMAEEYIQPELLADDGETEVIGLFDLLAGLLDWNPEARIGKDEQSEKNELLTHEYWVDAHGNAPDWELIDKRLLPSPLLPIVMERMGGRQVSEESGKDLEDELVRELARSLAAARDQTDAANRADSAATQTAEQLKLIEEEAANNVEDWEFSSEKAIETEYTENHDGAATVV